MNFSSLLLLNNNSFIEKKYAKKIIRIISGIEISRLIESNVLQKMQ